MFPADGSSDESGVVSLTSNKLVPFAEADSGDTQTPAGCRHCGSPEATTPESFGPGVPDQEVLGWVDYRPGECDNSCDHASCTEAAAPFADACVGEHGVLQRGDIFLHCGEPMEEGQLQVAALRVDSGDLLDAPSVRVEMMVLRCACGFQMSVPTD